MPFSPILPRKNPGRKEKARPSARLSIGNCFIGEEKTQRYPGNQGRLVSDFEDRVAQIVIRCLCEPVVLRAANQNPNDCQWQSYLNVGTLVWQSVPPVLPWLPLWGNCHGVTERVSTPSPPRPGTSPKGRGKTLIRLALAGDARATFPQGKAWRCGL